MKKKKGIEKNSYICNEKNYFMWSILKGMVKLVYYDSRDAANERICK